MAARVADVVQVIVLAAGPHAFLAAGRHVIGAFLAAEKNVLELVHAGVDEKQRRVLGRNQRRTLDNRVAAVRKKLQELPPNFIAVHGAVLFPLEWRTHRIQDEAKP